MRWSPELALNRKNTWIAVGLVRLVWAKYRTPTVIKKNCCVFYFFNFRYWQIEMWIIPNQNRVTNWNPLDERERLRFSGGPLTCVPKSSIRSWYSLLVNANLDDDNGTWSDDHRKQIFGRESSKKVLSSHGHQHHYKPLPPNYSICGKRHHYSRFA